MRTVELLCLANSRKLNGRCISGLTNDGTWIRPVHPDGEGTLYWQNYRLDDGTEPALLDVIGIELERARPLPHQPENWVIAPRPWRRLRSASGGNVQRFLCGQRSLTPQILGSVGDRMPQPAGSDSAVAASLTVVEPQHLRWRVVINARGRRQTRARFTVSGQKYDLAVTDPVVEARLGSVEVGDHSLGAAGYAARAHLLLTISLGEPLDGVCYKVVAGVVELG
jgi:hypothetical protein